jgi:hypothetical protein
MYLNLILFIDDKTSIVQTGRHSFEGMLFLKDRFIEVKT